MGFTGVESAIYIHKTHIYGGIFRVFCGHDRGIGAFGRTPDDDCGVGILHRGGFLRLFKNACGEQISYDVCVGYFICCLYNKFNAATPNCRDNFPALFFCDMAGFIVRGIELHNFGGCNTRDVENKLAQACFNVIGYCDYVGLRIHNFNFDRNRQRGHGCGYADFGVIK
jgi:hypothetical protein